MSTPPIPLRKVEVSGAEELLSEGRAPGRPVSTRRVLTVVRPGRQMGDFECLLPRPRPKTVTAFPLTPAEA
ncbi:hypothetical protein [Streptomyces sp. V4I2]|uniref:hypothetical protein n=1 Tax=Streptomyces sp. V4I2 TaxID=3042280 RepID=UPI0027860A89|nr:hypothetical protein [Streptomyces sp. V4I2]MDQ1050968.1 hypothetical protein [Streptomyces sp. V4I2]